MERVTTRKPSLDLSKSFWDLNKMIPELNTTVQTFFWDTDNPKLIFVKVVGYNGKVTELDSFLVLLDYHGVLIEKRLDKIYPIPLTKDYLIQLGWKESEEIEKGDSVSFINKAWNTVLGLDISLKLVFSPGIKNGNPKGGKEDLWFIMVMNTKYRVTRCISYKVNWYHDLLKIYRFLGGVIELDYWYGS